MKDSKIATVSGVYQMKIRIEELPPLQEADPDFLHKKWIRLLRRQPLHRQQEALSSVGFVSVGCSGIEGLRCKMQSRVHYARPQRERSLYAPIWFALCCIHHRNLPRTYTERFYELLNFSLREAVVDALTELEAPALSASLTLYRKYA